MAYYLRFLDDDARTVAPTPGLFALFRFLAGIGIDGIPPTAIAQVFEFPPDNREVLFNAIMLGGFGIGAIIAPAVSLLLIGHVGFCGLFGLRALPLVTLAPLASLFLPALRRDLAAPRQR